MQARADIFERYAVSTPEWTRRLWSSRRARETWEPRCMAIGREWEAAERASVGVFRAACLQIIRDDSIVELSRKAAQRGLVLIHLARTSGPESYRARGSAPIGDGPDASRVVLITRRAACRWIDAWDTNDTDALGEMLGYPSCCRAFFDRVWNSDQRIDTTWDMACGSVEDSAGQLSLVLGSDLPTECNILLRWLGVRWVPHLPCSFGCERTVALARQFRAIMRAEPAAWMDELLNSPVEWSAWHGIAEIRTPIVALSATTDATSERLTVRRVGSVYPTAGATGTDFPYRRSDASTGTVAIGGNGGGRVLRVVDSDGPRGVDRREDERTWVYNGFATQGSMIASHGVVLSVAALESPITSALDLGAGTGRLLSLVDARRRVGIEIDSQRVAYGMELYGRRVHLVCDSIENLGAWSGDGYDLIMLMPGRLIELDDPARVARAIEYASTRRVLLVYAYGDWLDRYGSLAALCASTPLPRNGRLVCRRDGASTSAGLWRW